MGVLWEAVTLTQEHPDLPVIPVVHAEVVADTYVTYWVGRLSRAEVKRYLVLGDAIHVYKERAELQEVERVLNAWGGREVRPGPPDAWMEQYRGLPWERAIFLYIDPPDGER